jgi:hypothetical protein
MGEQTPADRLDLREQIVKDWLRVTQRDMDVEEVLDYIEAYDIEAELLDVSLDDDPMSELESLAFHIKSREVRRTNDTQISFLMTVATTRPYLDMLFHDLKRYGESGRYRPCIDALNAFDLSQLEVLEEVTDEYWRTREFLSVAQNHVTLTNDLLEGSDPFSLEDLSDARRGINIYKKCMDICDSGFPLLQNMKYVVEGDDPREKDFISMGFAAIRNSLEDHEVFDPLVDAIDADLRNAISHGDIWVDNVENTIETNNPDKSYSLAEFEKRRFVVEITDGSIDVTFESLGGLEKGICASHVSRGVQFTPTNWRNACKFCYDSEDFYTEVVDSVEYDLEEQGIPTTSQNIVDLALETYGSGVPRNFEEELSTFVTDRTESNSDV